MATDRSEIEAFIAGERETVDWEYVEAEITALWAVKDASKKCDSAADGLGCSHPVCHALNNYDAPRGD